MASSSFLPFSTLFLGIAISILISLFSPSHSALTCASQKLPSNRKYANCTDLPTLGATLHFTYNETNRSIAVAFAAAPPKDGWVSWGINLAGGGMQGAQALVAYKAKDVVGVHLYNLSSYALVTKVESFSFETWDLSAEEAGGAITIYAALKVPEKADNVSQIWQVGPVMSGSPGKHDIKPENLAAKMKLPVVSAKTGEGGGNTTAGDGNNTTAGSPSEGGGAHVMGERFGLGFYLGLVLVMMGFFTM